MNWDMLRKHLEKYIPKQHNLQGTLLYRIIGDKLFKQCLWKPSPRCIAGGLAIGIFIALTPTFGAQMVISGISAYLLQVNIPIALAACWITNPLTMPFIYTLEYKLGLIISGRPTEDQLAHYSGHLKTFVKYAKPLWIGSLVCAAFFALMSYIIVFAVWDLIENKVIQKDNSNLTIQ